jgi:signal transduction histidine kinase
MADDPTAIRQRFAHTLLSPLTVILGSLDMLLNQDTAWPGYAKEVLELALAQAHRLHDTLNQLLDAAEIENDTVLISWSPQASWGKKTLDVPAGQGEQASEPKGRETST